MAVLVRITDFVPSTLIKSQEMDDELNQLVNLLSGVSTSKDTLLKFSDGSNPVLRVDQLGAGVIQQWLQNGSVKAIMKGSGFMVGVEKAVSASFGAIAANSGAGLTTMLSTNIAAGSLAANNDYAVVILGGVFANNDNDKRLQLTIGGTVFYNTGLIDIDNFGYSLVVIIGRIDSTHVTINIVAHEGETNITSGAVVASTGFITEVPGSASLVVADLASNNLAILFESQGTANNDILLNQAIIKVCQMS